MAMFVKEKDDRREFRFCGFDFWFQRLMPSVLQRRSLAPVRFALQLVQIPCQIPFQTDPLQPFAPPPPPPTALHVLAWVKTTDLRIENRKGKGGARRGKAG